MIEHFVIDKRGGTIQLLTDAYTASTSFNSVEFTIECSSGGESSNQCDSLTEATTSFPVSEAASLTYDGTTTIWGFTESISTEVQVEHLKLILPSMVSAQRSDWRIKTIFTTTISTSAEIAIAATTLTISPSEYTLTVPVDSRGADSSYSTTMTLSSTVITLSVASVSTSISIEKVTTELTRLYHTYPYEP